jgi:cyclic pyranopterin phosphate synthase
VKNKLDSHKVNYHVNEISDLFNKELKAPIYVEISPTGICNHKCLFCHYNYLGHEGKFKKGKMLELVQELAKMGVKSIVFAGNGEPTLHVDTIEAIQLAKCLGVDVAMSTNGALLKEKDLEILVNNLTWIRFSFNAGSEDNYELVHKTNRKDFNKVIDNIKKLKAKKDELNSNITIGTQYVLIPENKDFVLEHGKMLKSLGVDYFSVKHFYQHSHNEFEVKENISEQFIEDLSKKASEISTDGFNFMVRSTANLSQNRAYTDESIPTILAFGKSCFNSYNKKALPQPISSILQPSFKLYSLIKSSAIAFHLPSYLYPP